MGLRDGLDDCYPKSLFLKMGFTDPQCTAKGCQVFREMEMRNGRRVFLVVVNVHVRIETRVATVDTNHSVTDSTQIIIC